MILCAALFPATESALPSGFVGQWAGVPDYAVVGPIGLFNFTVTELEGSGGNGWLMEDTFNGSYLIRSTVQHFWVLSSSDGTSGNLTYCGVLRGFFDMYGDNDVDVVFALVKQSGTVMQWTSAELGATWTLTLSGDGNILTSYVQMPPPVVHLQVRMERVTGSPRISKTHVGMRSISSGHVCNFSSALSSSLHVSHSTSRASATPQKKICPYAARMRQMVVDSEAADSKKKQRAGEYQHCYVLNKPLNITIQWTWDAVAKSIHVLFSGKVDEPSETGAVFQYLALGIWPNWPAMQGMDIVLGYPTAASGGCVRSMYAEEFVGTPVDNEKNQTLTNRELMYANGTVNIRFTRPWNTGHHNLAQYTLWPNLPVVSWAIGAAGASCTDSPHYHFGKRGTYGMWWQSPSAALPAYLKCDQQ